jgi:aldehyde:ferredoxin oxidoreductase
VICRIDMSTGAVTREPLPAAWQGLGGRALTSALVSAEVPPGAEPLGAENRLVLAPGLLSGTSASSSGRLSVGAKSPLTGGIKESNVGGLPGSKLARLGIRALVVEGKAAPGRWYVLELDAAGTRLRESDVTAGERVYATVAQLRAGTTAAVVAIGPAGEMRLPAAAICVTDLDGVPSRHAGRGGLGAVMGAKGLTAIVIDDRGAGPLPLADPERFRRAMLRFAQALRDHPTSGRSMPIYGTSILVNTINEAGGLPTRNFRSGSFEAASQISGEALHDLIVARGGRTTHACMPGCVIRCSNVVPDPTGEECTRGLEYESLVLLGANCGIGDLDTLAHLNRLCDELGLDTMETGVALGVAMEGGLAAFGDGQRALALVEEIGAGTPLGRLLGHGAAVAGRVLGVERIPAVKGQGMPAYDPRALKGTGVTYATSPMGADHTAGNALPGTVLPGVGKPDPARREHQVELSRYLQELAAIFDSVGLCWFTRGPILAEERLMLDLLDARWGGAWSMEGLWALGRQVLALELAFNRAAGLGPATDRLPDFFRTEVLPPRGLTFDIPPEAVAGTLAGLG